MLAARPPSADSIGIKPFVAQGARQVMTTWRALTHSVHAALEVSRQKTMALQCRSVPASASRPTPYRQRTENYSESRFADL